MTSSIKHQIEWAIEANKKNAQTLQAMLDVYQKLEPEGWTPKIYEQFVRELYRVQMCVVHRGTILSLIDMFEEINADDLPDESHYLYDDQNQFTRQDFERVKESVNAALIGLPPA